jgi:hypothetical protein
LPTGLKASVIKVSALYYLRLTMCGLVSPEVYQMIVDFSNIVDLLLQPVFEEVCSSLFIYFIYFFNFAVNTFLYFYQEHRVKVTRLARAFVINMRDILHVDTTITFHVLSEHLADYRLHFSSFRELSTFRHEHFLRLYTQSKVCRFLFYYYYLFFSILIYFSNFYFDFLFIFILLYYIYCWLFFKKIGLEVMH